MKKAILKITPELIGELLKLPENISVVRAHVGRDIADPCVYLDLVGDGLFDYHEGDWWNIILPGHFGD